jgi:predicted RNA-binding Zn ribbon-like protein
VPLWGETLCLDFTNSVDWDADDEHFRPAATDVLRTEDMLRRWARRLDLIDDRAEPPSGAEVRHVRALREAAYRVFAAIGREQAPLGEHLDVLMANYVEAVESASLEGGPEHAYQLDWARLDARRIRYAVAAGAVALLQDPGRLKRVSRCPGRDCGWLFLNTSGRRRWCSMSTCGSREKMRRLHRRRTVSA